MLPIDARRVNFARPKPQPSRRRDVTVTVCVTSAQIRDTSKTSGHSTPDLNAKRMRDSSPVTCYKRLILCLQCIAWHISCTT